MANVLNDEKRQQVVALGQLGWTLRRIEAATGPGRLQLTGSHLLAFSETLAMSAHRPDRKRRNGLAAFRALEPEVRAALDAGWTLTAIFELHQQRLAMSYAQFARYAQPIRQATRAAHAPGAALARTCAAVRAPVPAPTRTDLPTGNGPPRGRPEDAVPTLDMDGFAAKALKSEDLF